MLAVRQLVARSRPDAARPASTMGDGERGGRDAAPVRRGRGRPRAGPVGPWTRCPRAALARHRLARPTRPRPVTAATARAGADCGPPRRAGRGGLRWPWPRRAGIRSPAAGGAGPVWPGGRRGRPRPGDAGHGCRCAAEASGRGVAAAVSSARRDRCQRLRPVSAASRAARAAESPARGTAAASGGLPEHDGGSLAGRASAAAKSRQVGYRRPATWPAPRR